MLKTHCLLLPWTCLRPGTAKNYFFLLVCGNTDTRVSRETIPSVRKPLKKKSSTYWHLKYVPGPNGMFRTQIHQGLAFYLDYSTIQPVQHAVWFVPHQEKFYLFVLLVVRRMFLEFYFALSVFSQLAVQEDLLVVLNYGLSVCVAPACVRGTISMLLPSRLQIFPHLLSMQSRIWRCEEFPVQHGPLPDSTKLLSQPLLCGDFL